jgi:hypothetical protein
MTGASKQALSILRDPCRFQWYVITIFVPVIYVCAVEIQKPDRSMVPGSIWLS